MRPEDAPMIAPWLGSRIAHGHAGPTQLGGLKAAFLLEVPGR